MRLDSFGSALLAAAILGVLNAVVRPVLLLLTLPLTIVTLGFFILVINALMFMLAGAVVPSVHVASFSSALRFRHREHSLLAPDSHDRGRARRYIGLRVAGGPHHRPPPIRVADGNNKEPHVILRLFGREAMTVVTGLERILTEPEWLSRGGRRWGLLYNQASVNQLFQAAPDLINSAFPGRLRALFGPQHGVAGTEQADVIETAHAEHPRLHVPVFSLYAEDP